jgi:hypothetical protein
LEIQNKTLKSVEKVNFLSLLMALFWIVSCSLFEPRGSEPPIGNQTGRFVQPDRAEIVLDNLVNAISVLNVQNFMASLDATQFVYTPANSNSTTDPSLWQSWGREQELLWLNNIRSAATVQTGHQLQLGVPVTENISQNRTRFTVTYSLTIFHNRVASGIPSVAIGSMVLTVKAGENGLWSVESWTDIDRDDGFSWSDLRSAFIRG